MKHFIQHWRNIFRFLSLAFMFVLAACENNKVNSGLTPQDELRLANKRACGARGEVVISMSKSLGETCEQRTARLNDLVKTDQDCKAYFGDKPVQVTDVCD